MDITLKQLQIFQDVVVAGSITKASRRAGLSQPAISQQLGKLEEKLGAQLIELWRIELDVGNIMHGQQIDNTRLCFF